MIKNKLASVRLCAALDKIDLAIPGRLRTVTMKCGKASCHCSSGQKQFFHGPYFFWDRKVKGKLSSLSIPEKLVPKFQRWRDNRKKIEDLVKKLLDQGQLLAANSKHQ